MLKKGFINEEQIAQYLNNKKVKWLYPNYLEMIIELYHYVDFNAYIKCWVDKSQKKYDIVIMINGIMKRISIKMGHHNSVHSEGISYFIHFLIENKVPKQVIEKYLLFHYADGTTNGSGKVRIGTEEYKTKHANDIAEINYYFNQENLLAKAIDRFVLKGTNSLVPIDGIIYGEEQDFLFINSNDIKTILMKRNNIQSSGVHFGNLFCQAKAKNLQYNPKYEKDRYCVQIKWFAIFDDIIDVMNSKICNACS